MDSTARQVSIILPTYNESKNIIKILDSIKESMPSGVYTEAIVVDDNSPDGTGNIVENYLASLKRFTDYTVDVIHRGAKKGLGSAILKGIQHAQGETIVVMDSDFSHPPSIIPQMIETLHKTKSDIVIASRYVAGGAVQGWSKRRRMLSRIATSIAKKGLGVNTNDPMSGFFAFKKSMIKGLDLEAIGFKLLLEILVKTKNAQIQEIPYTFRDRQHGSSKLGLSTVVDFCKSVWELYRYGKSLERHERRKSVRFLSKVGRFYTVGASGFGVNYLISLFASGFADMWYLHANIIGIITSMTTNFVLNKAWTFEDKDFTAKKTVSQYSKFVVFSSFGAAVQLGMVYWLVDTHSFTYPLALMIAVATAAFSNFILNKKWTFKERLWE